MCGRDPGSAAGSGRNPDRPIPKGWEHLEIEKDFRGKHLHIRIENPDGRESGFQKLILNGRELDSSYIPAGILEEENEIRLIL